MSDTVVDNIPCFEDVALYKAFFTLPYLQVASMRKHIRDRGIKAQAYFNSPAHEIEESYIVSMLGMFQQTNLPIGNHMLWTPSQSMHWMPLVLQISVWSAVCVLRVHAGKGIALFNKINPKVDTIKDLISKGAIKDQEDFKERMKVVETLYDVVYEEIRQYLAAHPGAK